jgi:hypothetical protein
LKCNSTAVEGHSLLSNNLYQRKGNHNFFIVVKLLLLSEMSAVALLVGLTEVDNNVYRDNYDMYYPDLPNCARDLDKMNSILVQRRFSTTVLKTQEATADNVLQHLYNLAKVLEPGSIFVFYYTGHGQQVKDEGKHVGYPFKEGMDDVLVCYRGFLYDLQLADAWNHFKPGVRIVMISDSCHSGTNEAIVAKIRALREKFYGSQLHAESLVSPTFPNVMLLHYGAVRDDETAPADGEDGSPYTSIFLGICTDPDFTGDYQKLGDAVADQMGNSYGVHAQFNHLGNLGSRQFQGFLHQRPFTI